MTAWRPRAAAAVAVVATALIVAVGINYRSTEAASPVAVSGLTSQCAVDVGGYCTVPHGLGAVPAGVVVTPAGIGQLATVDGLTASTFRVRFWWHDGHLFTPGTVIRYSAVLTSVASSPSPSASPSTIPPTSATPSTSPTSASPTPGPTIPAACTDPIWQSTERLAQWTNGNYLINNNVFNATESGPQTIFACSPFSWYVTAQHPAPGGRTGSIKSYPDTQRNFTDRTIDSFTVISSSFDTTAPAVGEWDAAYDVWVNGIGSKSTAEIMVWTSHRYNGVLPPPNALETKTVTVDGQTYKAWMRKNGNGGNYIALVMDPVRPKGTVDLLKVFDTVAGFGWVKTSDRVAAIEFGFEIADTAGATRTFKLNDYALDAR